MDTANPFQSPDVEPLDESSRSPTRGNVVLNYSTAMYVCVWTMLFALNMIVPAVLGYSLTTSTGRIGMVVGAITLWLPSMGALLLWRGLAPAFFLGAGFVAISQVVPMLQFIAGIIAVETVRQTAVQTSASSEMELLAALGATWITGGILMAVSFVIGGSIQAISRFVRQRREKVLNSLAAENILQSTAKGTDDRSVS